MKIVWMTDWIEWELGIGIHLGPLTYAGDSGLLCSEWQIFCVLGPFKLSIAF